MRTAIKESDHALRIFAMDARIRRKGGAQCVERGRRTPAPLPFRQKLNDTCPNNTRPRGS